MYYMTFPNKLQPLSQYFLNKHNHCISSGRNMLLVFNDTTKERHLCVERFAISLLPTTPKRRNEQHVPEQAQSLFNLRRNILLVSNNTIKERHLCVERFATFLLPKCRNIETSNMFRSKPNNYISSGGIRCSFPMTSPRNSISA